MAATNASRTMLMELSTLTWHTRTMEALGIPAGCLPEIRPSSGDLGHVAASCCDGALEGVPIAGCLGDQMAALMGAWRGSGLFGMPGCGIAYGAGRIRGLWGVIR